MTIQFLTTDNLLVSVEGGAELEVITKELNNFGLIALALADQVVSKDLVRLVREVTEDPATHLLHTKDGSVYEIVSPDYNAGAIAQSMNQNQITFVRVGNMAIQKHQINRIVPKETTAQ